MAQAIITITDTDLDKGLVDTSIVINETAMDDGLVTAAHFFGDYIKNCMRDPKFLAAAWAHAESLMADNPTATIENADLCIVANIDEAASKAA